VRSTPRTGDLVILTSLVLAMVLNFIFLCTFGMDLNLFKATIDYPSSTNLWIVGLALLLGGVSFLGERADLSTALRLAVHIFVAVGIVLVGIFNKVTAKTLCH